MNRFLISEVYIENFRGYKKGVFPFFKNNPQKRGLVILGGPNGFGKTSLIDAIEWCLSGNVRRLETEFRARNRGENENQLLQKGILRHISGNGDTIVQITAQYKDENVVIKRIFNGKNEREVFDGISQVSIEANLDTKKEIESIIKEIQGIFYDRYICSYEKNIQIYQKGREDIYNMFSSFFGGNPQIEKIIENLEGNGLKGNKKVKGIIECLEEQLKAAQLEEKEFLDRVKFDKEVLEKEELSYKALSGYTDDISKYPPKGLSVNEKLPFELEKIQPESDKMKAIFRQKELLQALSKIPLCKMIKRYVGILKTEIELTNFRQELLEPFRITTKQILLAQQTSVGQLLNIKQRNVKTTKILNQVKRAKNLVRYVNILLKHLLLQEPDATGQMLRNKIDELLILEREIQSLVKQKDAFDSATPVIEALRALVDHVSGFQKYKENGNDKCPLCGSAELFVHSDIASTAKIMLGEEDHKRAEVEKQIKEKNQEFSTLFNTIRSDVIMQLEKVTKDIDLKIKQIESTEKIQLAASKYNFDFKTLDEERLLDREAKLVEELNALLLKDSDLEDNIFSFIEQEDNTLQGITSRINPTQNATRTEFVQWSLDAKKTGLEEFLKECEVLIAQTDVLSELSKEDFDSIGARVRVLEIMEKNCKNTTVLQDAKQSHEKSQAKHAKAQQSRNTLQHQVAELKEILAKTKELKSNRERKMTEQIINPVNQLYRRINRHTNFTDICLNRKGIIAQKSELIVTDSNGNDCFISNVLSTGQLSTLAISIFFATALRHKSSSFRCYFMDDPIQSMDDLNILSFVDLLRTETVFSNSGDAGFFDQIFISTCDEDLENLILHKLRGFGANYCSFHFTGYGKYIESSARGLDSEIIIENE